MSLKIRSETEFKARFPDAGAYAKSDEGCYATFLPEGSGISVLEPWGPDGAATLEEARGGRDVLLLNLPVNEVYPCRKGSASMRRVEDAGLSGDLTLHKDGGTALVSRGTKLFRMRMK